MKTHSEDGIALLVTLSFLLILSAMGIHALTRTQDELSVGGSSRRHTRNVAAADAGIQLVVRQMEDSAGLEVNTDPIRNVNLQDGPLGFGVEVRSGVLSDPTPQPIEFIQYVNDGSSGSQLNLGSGNGGGGQLGIYRVTVVAQDAGGGAVQVQAQLAVEAPSVGY